MSITLHKMKNLDASPRISGILSTHYSLIEPPRPNGVKRFEVGNQIVFALNRKNAERKAKLNKMVTLMPACIAKLQLSDVVESLAIWNWKMTAVI